MTNPQNNKKIAIGLIGFYIVFIVTMTVIGFTFFSHTGMRYWITLFSSLLPSTIFMIIGVIQLFKTADQEVSK